MLERVDAHVQSCVEDLNKHGGYWGDPDCDHEWAKPIPFQFTECVHCGRWKWHHENLIRRIRRLRREGARIPEADRLVPYKPRRRAA